MKKNDILAIALLGGICLLRLLFATTIGLVPDEAYYWDWSRIPAFGYFDHPPMVAWFIAASSHILGNSLTAIKAAAVIPVFIASLFGYFLAKQYVTRRSSLLLYIVTTNAVVLFCIGSLLITPDIPMMVFWSAALYCVYIWLFRGAQWAWFPLGILIGLGLLSKYIFVLFPASLILFLLLSPPHRSKLRSWQLYAAGLCALLVFLPNIVWNAHHGWIAIVFQMHHGLNAKHFPRFDYFGEYLGGQIGILSVFPAVLLVIAVVFFLQKKQRTPQTLLLNVFFLVPFLFFAWSSLQKRVEPNWPSPAYISGLILIPLLWETYIGSHRRLLRSCTIASLIIVCAGAAAILIHIHTPFLPLPARSDPTAQLRGWNTWAQSIGTLTKTVDSGTTLPLYANRYQETALLSFYLPGQPHVRCLNTGGRMNQYLLQQQSLPHSSHALVFVYDIADTLPLPAKVAHVMLQYNRIGTAVLQQNPHSNKPYSVFYGVTRQEF
jgi:4-amino-4-deoxy-L-arabinose transferase-like glycosyltransferase